MLFSLPGQEGACFVYAWNARTYLFPHRPNSEGRYKKRITPSFPFILPPSSPDLFYLISILFAKSCK